MASQPRRRKHTCVKGAGKSACGCAFVSPAPCCYIRKCETYSLTDNRPVAVVTVSSKVIRATVRDALNQGTVHPDEAAAADPSSTIAGTTPY